MGDAEIFKALMEREGEKKTTSCSCLRTTSGARIIAILSHLISSRNEKTSRRKSLYHLLYSDFGALEADSSGSHKIYEIVSLFEQLPFRMFPPLRNVTNDIGASFNWKSRTTRE